MKTSLNAEKPEEERKKRRDSDICLARAALYNPLNGLIYVPNINTSSASLLKVTIWDSGTFSLTAWRYFWALNNLHMFILFIRTRKHLRIEKRHVKECFFFCCSLLQLSSGIYVDVSAMIHQNKNSHNPKLASPAPVYSAVMKTLDAWTRVTTERRGRLD